MKTMPRLTTLCLFVATSVIVLAAGSPWMRSQEPVPATWGNTKIAKPILPPGNGKLQIALYSNIVPSAPGTPNKVKYQETCYSWHDTVGDLWAYMDASENMIFWNTTASRWEDAEGDPIDEVTEWTEPKPPKEE